MKNLFNPIILQVLFTADPTEAKDEVLELSAEDIFYSMSEEVPQEAHQYIVHLERKLKSKNEALKELKDVLSSNDKHSYYRNQVDKILKI